LNPAIPIFVLTYVLIALGEHSPRKLDRPTAALLGAVLMVASGSLSRREAAAALDLSTLALLFGMMVLLTLLMQSGLPTWLSFKLLRRCRSPQTLLALEVFIAGGGAALMLNDTVCLLGTPVILALTAQAGLPATPFLLALATSANIGSVITLTGNPQNMIIAHASGLSWSGFAGRMLPIGLICLAVNWLLLVLIYRSSWSTSRFREVVADMPLIPVQSRLALKSVAVFLALLGMFAAGVPMDFAALAAATLLLIWANRPPRETLTKVDWPLLLFFAGLFVVVAGFLKTDGYILQLLERFISPLGSGGELAGLMGFTLATVIGSNIFSNVPFVLIASHWIKEMSHPQFLWYVLALASTFAGNLTLLGSVANVIVAEEARPQAQLNFIDFLKIGLPVTLATTALGVLLLWIFAQLGWI
jgi:Na+/H+ antiporter NhaD/arsenite permease-like protein